MSDFSKDRGQRAHRGSLLDHAGDWPRAPSSAPERPAASERPAVAERSAGADVPLRPVPSLLPSSSRSARVSTGRPPEPGPSRTEPSLASEPTPRPGRPAFDPSVLRDRQARAAAAASQAPDPGKSGRADSAGSEKFGDHIARLIGRIGPESDAGTAPAAGRAPAQASDREAGPEAASRQSPRSALSEPWLSPEERAEMEREYRRTRVPARPPVDVDNGRWPAAGADDGTRPLLDPSILISAVWRYRRLIALATVAGGALGVIMALATPHKYYAESRLFVDPREIRVTEDDVRNQQLSTEAMLAITDSQLQILTSTGVLEQVIDELGLDQDPEFNGSMPASGLRAGLSLIGELFGSGGDPEVVEKKALQALRKAVSVGRDAKTFVLILGVESRDPEKSALIANKIIETYLAAEGQAQSNLLERTSESIDTRLNALRADLDAAEREVERYKAENGLIGVGGQFLDDKIITALSDQLANARAVKVGVKVKADNLARVKVDDVLSGAFPEELASSNLAALRKQYTDAKSNADALATRLGPRHPQYISAKTSLDTITREIGAELRRIVASSQTELQRAVETEQELASQMAVAKNRALDQSVEMVTLRELERKANATRGIYEAFLTRSRETSERSNLSTRNIRVISPAEPPIQPTGPSRKLIAIGGAFAGFAAGIGVALLVGAAESLRAFNSGPAQARFQEPPFGGYPTDPGPRTPPQGPSRRFWPRREDGAADSDRPAPQHTGGSWRDSAARAEADETAFGPASAQTAGAPAAAPAAPARTAATAAYPENAPAAQHAPQPLWAADPRHLPQQPYPEPPAPVMPQPPMMPQHPYAGPQPYPSQPAFAPQPYAAPHVAIPPQPYPAQPQYAPYPGHPATAYPVQPPMPQPGAYWHQPAPAVMPSHPQQPAPSPQPQPTAVAPQPPSEPAPAKADNRHAVDRIRRDMDTLKSRIVDYGVTKRRA